MTKLQLESLLARIPGLKTGVLGDFCLDAYWFVDESAPERSLETGLPVRMVREQRHTLGAAGNVAANLLALGCKSVEVFGVLGDDPWNRELHHQLQQAGARTEGMLQQTGDWSTLVYVKPHLKEAEQNRFDFGGFNALARDTADRLLGLLEKRLPNLDVLIVDQQARQGIHTEYFRQALAALMQRHPDRMVLADSRHFSAEYPGACLRIPAHDAARLCGIQRAPDQIILRTEVEQAARALFAQRGKPVFVSRGNRGVVVADADGVHEIPALQVMGKTDPVGAGDSLVAGIALALAAAERPAGAALFGLLAATVTMQKLRQTGTATPAEVLAIGAEPDFIFNPELAEDARAARYLPGTEFEVISAVRPHFRITHAIFDHDGTISTLRQGWEAVMEPVMIKAILGPRYATADESLYHRVRKETREYIDKTTGIQTLIQMQGLVRMVRDFGLVPPDQILDEHGYKKIYNDALMQLVSERIRKFKRGELALEDYTVKNAVRLLERLHAAGVKMHLASGTDEADVIAEAKELAYAHFFEGIHGAVGDVTREAKKMVLERLLKDIGPAVKESLVAFGDGPVEIRETRKRGGFTVGIASDEVQRFGLHAAKRTRLIRAGADLVIPDFSQLDALLRTLGIP